jgi:hypothetical protein
MTFDFTMNSIDEKNKKVFKKIAYFAENKLEGFRNCSQFSTKNIQKNLLNQNISSLFWL